METLDSLASRITTFTKGHLALSEAVKINFDGTMYEGSVAVAPPIKEDIMTTTLLGGYQISISNEELVMTAACSTPNDVTYYKSFYLIH